jgi:hypothetical protein
MSYPIYPLSKELATRRWKNWLLEPVEWDESEWIPRQACLEVFVKCGLAPFVTQNGYAFGCDQERIGECIARCIYYRGIRHQPLNVNYSEEDYEYYYFRVDSDSWERFWSSWSLWSDLKDEHPRIRELIRYCVWTLLDLDSSPAAIEYGPASSDSEDEEGGGGSGKRVDPYLQDASNGFFST